MHQYKNVILYSNTFTRFISIFFKWLIGKGKQIFVEIKNKRDLKNKHKIILKNNNLIPEQF